MPDETKIFEMKRNQTLGLNPEYLRTCDRTSKAETARLLWSHAHWFDCERKSVEFFFFFRFGLDRVSCWTKANSWDICDGNYFHSCASSEMLACMVHLQVCSPVNLNRGVCGLTWGTFTILHIVAARFRLCGFDNQYLDVFLIFFCFFCFIRFMSFISDWAGNTRFVLVFYFNHENLITFQWIHQQRL